MQGEENRGLASLRLNYVFRGGGMWEILKELASESGSKLPHSKALRAKNDNGIKVGIKPQ